ncbi:MAG TPA: trypsin-like peptidase domain-containing protein [Pirellulaceae bacterium]|nr:trypsin-like peptidase domain-containing protein [Pirellulaceae bacterium]
MQAPDGFDHAAPPPPSRPSTSPTLLALLAVLLVLVAISLFQSLSPRRSGRGAADAEPRPIAARGDLAADEKNTVDLFRQASRSVVFVSSIGLARDQFFNVTEVPRGSGTGFVWDAAGHIVTNAHVIAGARRLSVTLYDQSTWNAVVVGVAEDRDIAVLRIDAPADSLTPILIGSSSDLQVGQKVFAIGSPFGLDQTLTTGIVSGLGREIPNKTGGVIQGVIQTDAAINPGNSGGPLLDSAGRLIGVNTAIYSPTGTSAGIGFAIPVDMVNRTVPQIVKIGRVARPGLGVLIMPDAVVERLKLTGVLIREITPNSAAQRAGLQPTTADADGNIHLGDIIQELAGKKIEKQDDLFAALEQHQVGDVVTIVVLRNAKTDEQTQVALEVKLQDVGR